MCPCRQWLPGGPKRHRGRLPGHHSGGIAGLLVYAEGSDEILQEELPGFIDLVGWQTVVEGEILVIAGQYLVKSEIEVVKEGVPASQKVEEPVDMAVVVEVCDGACAHAFKVAVVVFIGLFPRYGSPAAIPGLLLKPRRSVFFPEGSGKPVRRGVVADGRHGFIFLRDGMGFKNFISTVSQEVFRKGIGQGFAADMGGGLDLEMEVWVGGAS